MNVFGIAVFSFGVLFFFCVWLIDSFQSLKDLIIHFSFRIISDIAVENEELEKKLKGMIDDSIKRHLNSSLSNLFIKILNERDENRKN